MLIPIHRNSLGGITQRSSDLEILELCGPKLSVMIRQQFLGCFESFTMTTATVFRNITNEQTNTRHRKQYNTRDDVVKDKGMDTR